MPAPLPLLPTSGKDLLYLPIHFLKVYIDSPGEFHLGTSGLYIMYINQITLHNYLLFITVLPQYSAAYRILYYEYMKLTLVV
jgi:hypothetical protein